MAAAEARAGWQRTANRYFVQEDAKRAPKLPPYPSSSSNSDSDYNLGDIVKGSDHLVRPHIPHNQTPSNPDLLNETKWWLHIQPNVSTPEVIKVGMNQLMEDDILLNTLPNKGIESCTESKSGLFVGQPRQAFPTYKKDFVKNGHLLSTPTNKGVEFYPKTDREDFVPTNKDRGELWYGDDHLFELEPCSNYEFFENSEKVCSEMESDWVGVEKAAPWWRTADKDELASFVSHKSLEQFENCDLPRPRPQCVNQAEVMASSGRKVEKATSNLDDHFPGTPNVINTGRPLRHDNLNTTKLDDTHKPTNDLTKSQLLEALCHSQTRAREAEKAAQHAHNEKEHIIKLFFRQASHLFAYKQWLQILQLETLALQFKNNPAVSFFPWAPCKGMRLRKVRRKIAKKKVGPPPLRYKPSWYVVFAVGLGLVGAGLLLGWTMGWLFPAL